MEEWPSQWTSGTRYAFAAPQLCTVLFTYKMYHCTTQPVLHKIFQGDTHSKEDRVPFESSSEGGHNEEHREDVGRGLGGPTWGTEK